MQSWSNLTKEIEDEFHRIYRTRKKSLIKSQELHLNTFIGSNLEDVFFSMCKDFEISQFIECGAHEAHASLRVLAQTPQASIFAYEANPRVYARYLPTFPSSMKYMNFAVSNSQEGVFINIKSGHTPSWSAEGFVGKSPESQGLHISIPVPTTTLDVEAIKMSQSKRTAIWIDVEGSNHLLVEGGKKFFSQDNVKLLYIETQIEKMFPGEYTAQELCDVLRGFGFDPVLRDWPFHWGCNILFVRRELFPHVERYRQAFWRANDNYRIPFLKPPDFRTLLRRIKLFMLKLLPEGLHFSVHRLARTLGSKSSADLD